MVSRQVGLAIPTAAPDVQPRTAVEFARRADAARAHSVWALDRLVFNNYEPLLSLTAAAAVTERVRLGTSVLLATLRRPPLLAKMIATLDQMSGGRVTLGIGVGSRADDFAAAEVPYERRGGRAEELVRVLKLAWSGAPLQHRGTFYQFDLGPIGPRPAQQPHPPIWFGGGAESALRRVGRIADGYIGSSANGPEGFKAAWDKVRGYAEAAGRDVGAITPAVLVYACVDDDRERAMALASKYMVNYYGPKRADVSHGYMLGSPDECVRVANSYFQAGVQMLIVGSVTAEVGYFDGLCQEVVPRLREDS